MSLSFAALCKHEIAVFIKSMIWPWKCMLAVRGFSDQTTTTAGKEITLKAHSSDFWMESLNEWFPQRTYSYSSLENPSFESVLEQSKDINSRPLF